MIEKAAFCSKKGMAPGTLLYVGDTEPVSTSAGYYLLKKDSIEYVKINLKNEPPLMSSDYILWVRVTGLADMEFIKALGKAYDIGYLTLEDILETSHSAKLEKLNSYIFIIMKILSGSTESEPGQINIILRDRSVITFEETPCADIDAVAERLKKNPDAFYEKGADYLVYAFIDSIVDSYLDMLDGVESGIDDVEDKMICSQSPIDTEELFDLKRRINYLYRISRPTYEIVEKLTKPAQGDIVAKDTAEYLKDLMDHASRLHDNIQNGKDAVNALYDENISRMQLRTNNFINLLTMVSVLLLPPMVISGIYGMNFSYIPGIHEKYGFFLSLGIMVAIFAGLLFFFKKKKLF